MAQLCKLLGFTLNFHRVVGQLGVGALQRQVGFGQLCCAFLCLFASLEQLCFETLAILGDEEQPDNLRRAIDFADACVGHDGYCLAVF